MAYPLVFRPNHQVDIYNFVGALQAANVPTQFFKPLVGTKDNDLTRPPWGSIEMSGRAVIRAVLSWPGDIPLSPSLSAAGSWLVRTTSAGAAIGTFVVAGGFRWDDNFYWLILAQL